LYSVVELLFSQNAWAAAGEIRMRCSYCHRPLRLLDRRHPQRLLLPRCRVCRGYTFGAAHKLLLLLLSAFLAFLLMSVLTKGRF